MKPAHETGCPAKLGLLIEEALKCLKSTDLPGANAALKKAHAEAALSRLDTPSSLPVVTKDGAVPGAGRTGDGAEDRG